MTKISPALKSEAIRITTGTAIGTVVMWIVFLVLHFIWPEKVPFDYTVILGGLGGFAAAAGNFFLMGLAVQKVTAETDEKRAYQRMQVSQRQRFLIMMIWGGIALIAPCFNGVAGIVPLLMPSLVIKIYYLTAGRKKKPETKTAEEGSEE